MNSLLFEVIGFSSSFLLGIVCFLLSRDKTIRPIVLFWTSITFMFIGVLRAFSVSRLISIEQSRLAIGLFYPFILLIVFVEWYKGSRERK